MIHVEVPCNPSAPGCPFLPGSPASPFIPGIPGRPLSPFFPGVPKMGMQQTSSTTVISLIRNHQKPATCYAYINQIIGLVLLVIHMQGKSV